MGKYVVLRAVKMFTLKHLHLPLDLEVFDGISHLLYNCIFIKAHNESKENMSHSSEWQ